MSTNRLKTVDELAQMVVRNVKNMMMTEKQTGFDMDIVGTIAWLLNTYIEVIDEEKEDVK